METIQHNLISPRKEESIRKLKLITCLGKPTCPVEFLAVLLDSGVSKARQDRHPVAKVEQINLKIESQSQQTSPASSTTK